MIDYKSSFKRPFTDLTKLVIGILLSIIPIVRFFTYGYLLDAARLSMKKKFELPEWKNPGTLFIDGLSLMLIRFIYILPAVLIFIVGVNITLISSLFRAAILNDEATVLLIFQDIISALGPLLFVTLFLILLAFYLLPIAILRYADTKKIVEAFNMKKILSLAFSSIYPGPWIIAVIVNIIALLIFGNIPYIGSGLAIFIAGMINITILSQAYSRFKHHI